MPEVQLPLLNIINSPRSSNNSPSRPLFSVADHGET